MGRMMKEKAVGFQKMMAKSWVRRFLGITLLLFLVGLPGLYLLRSAVFAFLTARWILLPALTLITAILLVIWVFNTGGYSVWYRNMALRAAKLVGFLVRMYRTQRERLVKVILFTVLLLAAWQWLLPESHPVPKFLTWINFDVLLKLLVLLVIGKIIFGAFKLRKQIVFQKFKNLTGETSFDVTVEAIQEVLINRFNYLKELIYTIDEINPQTSKKDKMLSPSINVSEAVDSLKSVELSGQKIKVGSMVEIPLGFIVSAIRNLLKGPILTGSLHKKGDDLELIARMSGKRFSGNWRVHIDDLDEEEKKLPEKDRLEKMIEHLCCMIFTRLVSVGSNRWQAVHRYTEGLHAYRQASKKEKGKNIDLRRAEKAFIDALNEDNTFDLCHYNLGVVYEELGQDDSAEVAFREVLKKDHENAEAYFNLGINYFYKGKYEDALWYAEQSIRLKPGDSRYWNMRGVIFDRIHDQAKESNKTEETKNQQAKNEKTRKENIIAAIKNNRLISFQIAAKLSWQNLCWTVFKGEDNLRLKNIARVCLSNLGLVHDYEGKYRKIRIFKQSIAVSLGEGKPYFELGKIFFRMHDWGKALFAFDKVFEEDSTLSNSIAYWTLYVYACKKLINQGKDDYETRCSNAKYHLLDAISEKLGDFFVFLSLEDINIPDVKTGIKKLEISEQDIKNGIDPEKFNDLVSEILEKEIEDDDDYLAKKLKDDDNEWAQKGKLCLFQEPKDESESENKSWSNAQIAIFLAKKFKDKQNEKEKPMEKVADNKAKVVSLTWKDCIEGLEGAIEKLKNNHEKEIRTHRLYGLLAECYLNNDKHRERKERLDANQKALYYSRKSVEIDPTSAEERCILSRVYFKMNDYQQALKELENCLILTPGDLEILRYSSIISNPDRVFFYDPEKRKNFYKSMYESIERGLSQMKAMVISTDSAEYMNTIYYKLGSFHRKLKNYDDAITYLNIAGTMGGRDALKAKLELGWTYMEAGAYNRAEQVFHELHKINFYSIDVLLGLAASIIERTISANGETELLKKPCGFLDDVEKQLLQAKTNTVLKSKIRRELPRYWAQYYGCRGRIAIKQGEPEDAVKHFEDSVSSEGSSWGYYFLAEAYYRRSQDKKEIKKGKQIFYLERAQDACIMSGNFDKKDLYCREVTALKQKIADALKGLKTDSPGENSRMKKYKVIEEK